MFSKISHCCREVPTTPKASQEISQENISNGPSIELLEPSALSSRALRTVAKARRNRILGPNERSCPSSRSLRTRATLHPLSASNAGENCSASQGGNEIISSLATLILNPAENEGKKREVKKKAPPTAAYQVESQETNPKEQKIESLKHKLKWLNRQIEAADAYLHNPAYQDTTKKRTKKIGDEWIEEEVSFHEFYAHLHQRLEQDIEQREKLISELATL